MFAGVCVYKCLAITEAIIWLLLRYAVYSLLVLSHYLFWYREFFFQIVNIYFPFCPKKIIFSTLIMFYCLNYFFLFFLESLTAVHTKELLLFLIFVRFFVKLFFLSSMYHDVLHTLFICNICSYIIYRFNEFINWLWYNLDLLREFFVFILRHRNNNEYGS